MKLREILDHKRVEVEARKRRTPESALRERLADASAPRPFAEALRRPGVALIAEVKKASPSKGVIREDFDPVGIGRAYAAAGAAAISVLTDEHFFMGRLQYLTDVQAAVDVPVLRKDFILERYQLVEARVAGADAVLLIVAALGADRLATLLGEAEDLGLETLVEVHTEAEVEVAVAAGAPVIGINNRDLATFETRLDVTRRLRGVIPNDRVVVSESGIASREDIHSLGNVAAVLVGESLMRQSDVGAAVSMLIGDAVRTGQAAQQEVSGE